MKKILWKLGIGLTILLCGLQIMLAVEGHMGGKGFTIESNAAQRVDKCTVSIRVFYFDSEQKRYVLDYSEVKSFLVAKGTKISLALQGKKGYCLKKLVIDGTTVSSDLSEVTVLGNMNILYMFDPLPSFEQIYQYHLYDTIREEFGLLKTEVESVLYGSSYTTRISFPQEKYHVQEIRFNNSPVVSLSDFSYVVKDDTLIDVYMYPNQTNLQFYDDTGQQVGSQTVYYGEKHKLMANPLKKTGYEFVGWKGEIDGITRIYQDQAIFETPYTEDQAVLKLTAEWKPIRYQVSLRYHVDEKEQGEAYSTDRYEWEDSIQLWDYDDHPDPMKNASLLGWNLIPDQKQPEYTGGQKLNVEALYTKAKEYDLVDPEDAFPVIELYPIWDMAPSIKTTHLYITGKDAVEGKITPEFLYQNLLAEDPEDGKLILLTDSSENASGVRFTDYQAKLFLTGKTGTVSLSVEARDSGGNVTMAQMLCTIVDSNGTNLGKNRRVRFISGEYLDTLKEDSVWNKKEEYRSLLEETLEKAGCL